MITAVFSSAPLPCKNRTFPFLMIGVMVAGLLVSTGCLQTSENEVVVYAALDKEFSEPILDDMEKELGITVLSKFDQESNKTVGLANLIIQNKNRPRADLFWNNEVLHTLRLENLGLLETYRSPEADSYPESFVSKSNQWHGFAARARVLIINKDLIPDEDRYPDSILDLANPAWKGKCCIARPLFGTTATHAAVLFEQLGESDALKLLTEISENAAVVGGNKQVAIKVARGEFAFGLTDTDDAIIEIENANPVAIVFPDQGENQMGTLLIPNTLAIVKNGPNTERAKRLVDRLLKADIEERLAKGRSAQIPLHQDVLTRSRVEREQELKVLPANFQKAAEHWDKVAEKMMDVFPTGGK